MTNVLNVAGLGMISALGLGADLNAASMRCHYDGFIKQGSFNQETETILSAPSPIDDHYRGSRRLIQMLLSSISEAMIGFNQAMRIPLYICLSDANPIANTTKSLSRQLMTALQEQPLGDFINYEQSRGFYQGRTSFVHACLRAQQQFEEQRHDYVLIVAVASLLSPQVINYFDSQNRLLTDDHADGFIPGEASVALLLTPKELAQTTSIVGMSLGEEKGSIEGDLPLTGDGLTQSVRQAAKTSGIPISETDFRLTTASGESYFFRELSIVHGRTLENPRQDHPLWHPADSIGEVGSASALAMVVMAHYAFKKHYAPGPQAICQVSNDNHERAAFILRYQEKQS